MRRPFWWLSLIHICELLSEYDFPGDDIPVIRGSALGALEGDAKWMDAIRELMKAVDEYIRCV